MPSNAYKTFQANLAYVDSIKSGPFKNVAMKDKGGEFVMISDENEDIKFNHTNRAALIILCGSWEQYIKDAVCDSGNAFIKSTGEWLNLHNPAQGGAVGSRKNPRQNQGMPESAIATWKNSYEKYISESMENISFPQCSKVYSFFKRTIGVTCEMFSPPGSDGRILNECIDTRHKIAHQGVEGNDVITRAQVFVYREAIHRLAANTDNYLLSQLRKMHPRKIPPWDGQAQIKPNTGKTR